LIKPHTSLLGPQLAGWTPSEMSQPKYRMQLETDISIPLQDGTALKGDLYRPRSQEKFPVLLAWSSYTKELHTAGVPMPFNEIGVVGYFVPRGYCHLTVNARGTGKSQGAQQPFFSLQEQQDVAETIEWAASQAWCDGNVGMVGMSYFAVIQYLAAAQRPSSLKAIFPYQALTDLYRHAVHKGGALHSQFMAGYTAFHGSTQWLSVPASLRNLLSYVIDRKWSRFMFPRVFPRMLPVLIRFFRPRRQAIQDYVKFVFDHPYDGPFYRERSPSSFLEEIDVPVCIGSNWGSIGLHLPGAFDAWHRLRSPKKLFIGPPEAVWPWKSYQQELLAWYDFHLKGMRNGYDGLPPVRYWLQGAGVWKEASDWPIPGATKKRFHLHASADSSGTCCLKSEAPAECSKSSFLAVPRKMIYPRQLDRCESQCLSYLSDPFVEETEIAGPVKLHLTVSSTALDAFLLARVSDLSPEGKIRKLAFGWLQLSHRKIDCSRTTPSEIVHDSGRPQALVPGEPVSVEFTLNPIANLFKKGHKLLLEIGSSADRLGTGFLEHAVFFLWDSPPYPARNTIFHGITTPSYLELDICAA
jgi:uncharacterized protein